ncbi:MAG: phosphoribosylpyrophosphate synthetase [Phaeodactylibacter sp.]|nr:phosphoribosylpyrophosphate synthetase [Phaeodactylibacter sp.]
MSFNQYQTLVYAEDALRKRGFTHTFKFEAGKMHCLENGRSYQPQDMVISEYHRFEGMSNPSDMSILFAIICADGLKGLIVSAYGPVANMALIQFLDKVKILRREEISQ